MKSKNTKSTLPILACLMLLLLSSCATMKTGKMTQLSLIDCPSDMKVYEDGKELEVKQVIADAVTTDVNKQTGNANVINYYAPGFELDKKKKIHKLTFESGGVKREFEIKLKPSNTYIFLDLLLTLGIGIPIDAATKRWRVAKNDHIDVPALMANKSWRSQKQLYRDLTGRKR